MSNFILKKMHKFKRVMFIVLSSWEFYVLMIIDDQQKKIKRKKFLSCQNTFLNIIWRPPSLSELTPYKISLGLTHLGSEASI